MSPSRLAIAFAALVAIGCGGDSTAPQVPVATVEFLQANSKELLIGESHAFQVQVKDASGNVLANRAVSWATSAPSVASVSGAGLVTALTAGNTTITATSEGKTAFATVTVSAPVANVVIDAPSQFITVGETMQLQGIPRDESGGALTRPLEWSTSDAGVATVSSTGLVTGVGTGPVTIAAAAEGKVGQVSLTGTSVATVQLQYHSFYLPFGTVQLGISAKDKNGGEISEGIQGWGTSAPAVATINGSGLLSLLSYGDVIVTGSVDGKSRQQEIISSYPLTQEEPLRINDLAAQQYIPFVVRLNVAAERMVIRTIGQSGAVVLFIGRNRLDEVNDWESDDCFFFDGSPNAVCDLANPASGFWSVILAAAQNIATVDLEVEITSAGEAVQQVVPVRVTPSTRAFSRGASITRLRRFDSANSSLVEVRSKR